MNLDEIVDAVVIPDAIEPVEGWRGWHFNGDHLVSSHNGAIWPPRQAFSANCCHESLLSEATKKHEAPATGCSCGIYAVKLGQRAMSCSSIVGKVKLWGKIIPGTLGFRAQYAYPSDLYAPPQLTENPALLAYGVPVIDHTEMHGGRRPTFEILINYESRCVDGFRWKENSCAHEFGPRMSDFATRNFPEHRCLKCGLFVYAETVDYLYAPTLARLDHLKQWGWREEDEGVGPSTPGPLLLP